MASWCYTCELMYVSVTALYRATDVKRNEGNRDKWSKLLSPMIKIN